MSEMFDHNSNNGETSEPKKGDFSEAEFLRKRVKELEAEVHGLRSQIAIYEKEILSYHKEISSHLRWVNGVFLFFIAILLGSGIFSFFWLRQQAMEQINSSQDKLQTLIYNQVKSLRFAIEKKLFTIEQKLFEQKLESFQKQENFGKDWLERLYKIEDRLNSLEKRLR